MQRILATVALIVTGLTLALASGKPPEEKRRQAIVWLQDGNIISGHVRGEVVVESWAEVTLDKTGTATWKAIIQPTPNQSVNFVRFETPALGVVQIRLSGVKRIQMKEQ